MYVNDLPQYTNNENSNLFADDTIIYSFGMTAIDVQYNLQGALNSVSPWYSTNRLGINISKSACMLIGKKSQVDNAELNL